jgi:hypothetical protein
VRRKYDFDLPHGIIAHLTKELRGNVRDRCVIEVTSGSFEKVTQEADSVAKNAADLEAATSFASAFRSSPEDIPHTRNNWICYDFKDKRIVPTYYAIRTSRGFMTGGHHLSRGSSNIRGRRESWQEVFREEDNGRFHACLFAVADSGECHFIRLVNIGKNHWEADCLQISASSL